MVNNFRPSLSCSFFASGCSSVEGGPTPEEESDDPGGVGSDRRRPKCLDLRTEETERKMEERRTKVLSMLSTLQEAAPRQSKGSSNFEDCECVTKWNWDYCLVYSLNGYCLIIQSCSLRWINTTTQGKWYLTVWNQEFSRSLLFQGWSFHLSSSRPHTKEHVGKTQQHNNTITKHSMTALDFFFFWIVFFWQTGL